ncbi:trypsin-like peptidase domain-containing protein [bacterium]|nr:trypsin-like peptidase domain-containing protein [bacterium]
MTETRRADTFWKVLSLVLLFALTALVALMMWQGRSSRPAFYQSPKRGTAQLASMDRSSGGKAIDASSNPFWIADLAEGALPTVVNIQSEASPEKLKAEHANSGEGGQQMPEGLLEQWQQLMPGLPDFEMPNDQHHQFMQPNLDEPMELGEGSGFIIREDGYIVTNAHVVDGGDTFTVTFNDGTTAPAKLVGIDEFKDIAVIKVDKSGLTPVQLGDSDATRIGEPVVAIGSPLGYKATVTSGILSTNQRKLTDITNQDDIRMPQNYLQTDAAINRGNSGGPLFNAHGEVIGVNQAITRWDPNSMTALTSGGMVPIEGVGFAIPINEVKSSIQQIVEHGKIAYPGISAKVATLSDYIEDYKARYDKEPQLKINKGVFIHSTVVGGPADKAGIKAGDVIISVDGKEVNTANDFVREVTNHRVGDRVTLKVARQGGEEQENVSVVLEELDSSGMRER